MLSGSDSLTISCRITPTGLAAKSKELLAAYHSNNYRQNYKWIDNIQPVKDEPLIAELNKKLLNQINRSLKRTIDPALQLASPEIINFESIDRFRIRGYKSKTEFSLPELPAILADMDSFDIEEVKLEDLERHRIEAIDGNDAIVSAWPVYDWLITEINHNRKHYVLSEGTWFVISRDFLRKINDSFANLIADVNEYREIGATIHKNEKEYLENYVIHVDEIILDKGLFRGYGPQNTIEICDIFNRAGEFIHVKDAGASSKLSHLFNQGYVSASMLISDRQFRQDVVDKLQDNPALAALIKDPVVAADHTVAYRILKSGRTFSLPFFSKVVVREMHRKIKMMGFKFRLEWVQRK